MANTSPALILDSIAVRQLDGLFCLNDLHAAAGGNPKDRPPNFLRRQETKALIAELGACSNLSTPLRTITDGENNGTYACRELVIAYAAWISAAFHLKVIRVFLAAQEQAAANPAIAYDRITPAQQQALQELVGKVVDSGKQGYAETWARFHRKFRVAKYNQLPIGQFDDAVAYLNAKLDGAPVHDADLVRVSAGQIITHAADMAGQLFAQVIKQAALNGSHIDRFVVEADYKARKVDMRLIKRDAYIMNDAEWLDHFKARVTHAMAA